MNALAPLLLLALSAVSPPALARTVVDGMGRTVEVPDQVERVICSGSGCMRLLTYMEAQHLAVAVDDAERRRRVFDARPYAIANPELRELPLFGQFRGYDNPELIVSLDPAPQVIFKAFATSLGHDPDKLQQKTGIPVVVLDYGDLGEGRERLYDSLALMGEVLGRQERAEEIQGFMEARIADLERRTADIPEDERPTVFVGGIAWRGPHGFRSTEPSYPPFAFVHARAPAAAGIAGATLQQSDVAKEKIVEWDPDMLFLDLSTLQIERGGGLQELRTDPAYRALSAVQEGRVYGLLPYKWYAENFGSTLANACYIGKVLYPDRFEDMDPAAEADVIYTFLLGEPVFQQMSAMFQGMAFTAVPTD